MSTPQTGCVGNLSRENFYKIIPEAAVNLGFILTLGYSDKLERAVIASLLMPEPQMELKAGITACTLWSQGIYEGQTKVIAVVSSEPFYDSREYLKSFADILESISGANKSGRASYYAEKFGYDRFYVRWEKDNPIELSISQAIAEFELEGTQEIVGGPTTEDFPLFMR